MKQPRADLRVAELVGGTPVEFRQLDDPLRIGLDRSPGQLPEGEMIDEALSERGLFLIPEALVAEATVATMALAVAAGAADGVDTMVAFDLNAVFCIGPEYKLRSTRNLRYGAAPRVAASFNKPAAGNAGIAPEKTIGRH